jgi:mannose-6-phosphate isomerase-like protein (cupin superfamily)
VSQAMQLKILKYDPEKEYFFREGCFINELSNTDDDPELSVARVRVRVGDCTAWHRLEGRIERYVILRGIGLVEIGDMTPTRVSEGDLVVIPAGCRQRIRNIGENELIFLALCTPRFLETSYREMGS